MKGRDQSWNRRVAKERLDLAQRAGVPVLVEDRDLGATEIRIKYAGYRYTGNFPFIIPIGR